MILSTIKFTETDVIKLLKQLYIIKGLSPYNIPLLILHNYATRIYCTHTQKRQHINDGKLLTNLSVKYCK